MRSILHDVSWATDTIPNLSGMEGLAGTGIAEGLLVSMGKIIRRTEYISLRSTSRIKRT